MNNRDTAHIIEEIGVYYAMEHEPFKSRAYQKAAETIAALPEEVRVLYARGGEKALRAIPSIGVAIADVIIELLTKGKSSLHRALYKKVPVKLSELLRVEGLGPKHIKQLYETLHIKDYRSLERALRAGRVAHLPGFGEKSQEKLLSAVQFARSSGGRMVLGFALRDVRDIARRLENVPGVTRVMIAGSIRRMRETIGDADIVVVTEDSKKVVNYFVSMPEVRVVNARGATKASVRLKSGLFMDIRLVPEESYGAALQYFTGSKDHNVALRDIAAKKGYTLNEYGLFRGTRRIAGHREEDIYRTLGFCYIPPELREMKGELEAAKQNTLPQIIDYHDLQGDLQVQTNWSDGKHSTEEMARAAIDHGLSYIAITDHTRRLAMTGGLDEKKLRRQMKEIDTLNQTFKKEHIDFVVLKGTECDILRDGTLDLPNRVLKDLDVVGVAVHSNFHISRAEQTKRIIRAIQNPYVDIVFHPTGRILGRRDAYEVDMDAIIAEAKKYGVALEIDAFPDRLDLRDDYVRQCIQAGVRIAIDSDAHAVGHFSYLECGIGTARRGWATKKDIINAWPLTTMLRSLRSHA